MKSAGLDVPLMGGDGIDDPPTSSSPARPPKATSPPRSVRRPTTLASAKKFVTDYAAAGYKEPYGAYGAYSYDAANAIINALKVSLADATDAKSARQATVDAVGAVSFDGATGPVSFDEFGDAKTKVLTVYKVTGGKWVADKTEEFESGQQPSDSLRRGLRWYRTGADRLPPRAASVVRRPTHPGEVRMELSSSSWSMDSRSVRSTR